MHAYGYVQSAAGARRWQLFTPRTRRTQQCSRHTRAPSRASTPSAAKRKARPRSSTRSSSALPRSPSSARSTLIGPATRHLRSTNDDRPPLSTGADPITLGVRLLARAGRASSRGWPTTVDHGGGRTDDKTTARERGAAAVEFALMLPLLLIVLFAIVDFGWVLQPAALGDGTRLVRARVLRDQPRTIPT